VVFFFEKFIVVNQTDINFLPVKSLRIGQGRFVPETFNHSLYPVELIIKPIIFKTIKELLKKIIVITIL